MAITQISVIQIRRGLQSDLANLASGEFGWAIDTQRLFIGNGTIDEGAPFEGMTEIMTYAIDFSETFGNYTYEGILGGYEVQTGATLAARVIRRVQDKLDDIVNVRDFGASGNGVVDDSPAIQRAIDELYDRQEPTTRIKTRRVLRFNAGIYRISEPLKIPPYFQLWGEGKESVIIRADGDFEALSLRTPTGKLVTDPEATAEQPPYSVMVTGVTFETSAENYIAKIDSARDIVFENVGFRGSVQDPDSATVGSCVLIESNQQLSDTIIFKHCSFSNCKIGIEVKGNLELENVIVENSKFNDLYFGVTVEGIDELKPNHIKVSNSFFKRISNSAITCEPFLKGIISLANTYIDVGNGYEGESQPAWPVLNLPGDGNYSIADYFARPASNDKDYPRVYADRRGVFVTNLTDSLRLGDAYTYAGRSFTIPNNYLDTIELPTRDHGVINYRIRRGDDNRTGRLKFSAQSSADDPNPTTLVVIDEEYVETDNVGVTFNVIRDNGILYLQYRSSPSGGSALITYNLETYHNYNT